MPFIWGKVLSQTQTYVYSLTQPPTLTHSLTHTQRAHTKESLYYKKSDKKRGLEKE